MKEMLAKMYMKTMAASGNLSFSAEEVAGFLGGRVIGDGKVRIRGMESLDFAGEGDITFAFTEDDLMAVSRKRASCAVTTLEKEKYPLTVIRVDDIKKAMTIMYNAMLEVMPPPRGEVHPSAIVADSAKIGKNVTIGPHAVVEERAVLGDNAFIGANCYVGSDVVVGRASRINPNVTIYERTVMGEKVIVHSGTVIGADGFGYVPKGDKIYKVPQMGNVVIGDNVEIGANSCLDRGTFARTEIGPGTKIDNLVQIAHNVKIGRNVLIAAQTGIAGSTVVGDNVMMGGQVGISDHVTIGKDVKLAAKSGISGRVQDGKTLFGYPAREAAQTKQWYALTTVLLKYRRELVYFLRSLPKKAEDDREISGGDDLS